MTSTTDAITYQQMPWTLAALFPGHDSPEMQAAFEELEAYVADFEARREALREDISLATFMEIVQQLEQYSKLAYKIYAFSQLWFTEDTQNQDAQAFMATVQQFMAGLQNRTLFFSLWWKGLDDENAQRLMAGAGDYRYWLQAMRNFKPFTLSEPEEKIINIKNLTGANALQTLYETLTNRYTFKLQVNGEVKELTRDALMSYVYDSDANIRSRAYQELLRVFAEDAPVLGQMYQVLVRDWWNEHVDIRKFPSPIAVRNLSNDIPDEVVDTLLEVCQQNAPLFQRYFSLKAKWLGLEQLRRYDIYAPVVRSDKRYAYPDAVEMVLNAFGAFEPRIAGLARQVFDEGHIDSQVRKGKQSGAFCYGVLPGLTPWVLVNYAGRARDVATLAHELGHAIHALLAQEHTLFTFHSSLPLAETASTFGEMLVIDYLLERETDQTVRYDLLFRQVDNAYATIIRQAFFALFERQAHEMIKAGATVDELAEQYMENLRTQFGEAVDIGDEFRWEWLSIPHIYSMPFYVYAYAFGQLLVLSLYQQYKVEGQSFIPRYLEILSAGGSASPGEILSRAGVDVRQAAFWQGGFDVIGALIEELENIPLPRKASENSR